jgi:hypothetical protein
MVKNKSKNIEGTCALCGQFKKLSFEHVPPKSALNNKPIFIQTFDHIMDKNSRVFGKKMTSNKGFGGYTLCETCNNDTGDWYARDFSDFIQQGMSIIENTKKGTYAIKGTYIIKPLNVLKQILTMFMSADKSGYLRSQTALPDFILEKEKTGTPVKFKIFLYSTLSHLKRMFGYSMVYDDILGIQKWSEINFQPFGYFLAEESQAAHKHMCDISSFGNYKYDEMAKIEITTPYLLVNSPILGTYH